jgi:hypothetical protein
MTKSKKVHSPERRVHTDGGDHNDSAFTSNSTVFPKKHPKKKITTFSMKPSLPTLKLNVPLGLSSSDIFEIFTNVSKN